MERNHHWKKHHQCSELLLSMIDYIWCGLKLLAFEKLAACYCKIFYIYIIPWSCWTCIKLACTHLQRVRRIILKKKRVVKCGNKSYYLSNIVFLRLFSLFTCIKIKCAKNLLNDFKRPALITEGLQICGNSQLLLTWKFLQTVFLIHHALLMVNKCKFLPQINGFATAWFVIKIKSVEAALKLLYYAFENNFFDY